MLPSSGRDWAFRASLCPGVDTVAPPSVRCEVVLSGPACCALSSVQHRASFSRLVLGPRLLSNLHHERFVIMT